MAIDFTICKLFIPKITPKIMGKGLDLAVLPSRFMLVSLYQRLNMKIFIIGRQGAVTLQEMNKDIFLSIINLLKEGV